ncbi:MAG: SurA N-terminal domain-containing protein [Hyphomicrobiaceae bacterium]
MPRLASIDVTAATGGPRRCAVGAVAAIVACLSPAAALAQQPTPTIPGLVVSTPSGPAPGPVSAPPGLFVTPPAPPPGASAAPPAPAKAAATHKPKPRPKPVQAADAAPAPRGGSSIVALVNDEPITGFVVEQRARFLALSGNIGERARERMKAIAQDPQTNERLKAILQETIAANRGKTKEQVIAAFETRKKAFVIGLQKQALESARASAIPAMRKQALQELIEERLKLQEAKKLSITITDADVDKIFKDMAQRNKMSPAEFTAHVASQGADASVIKSRLRSSLAWREVVKKRYGHHINVSQRDIESLAARTGGDDTQELKLQVITLSTAGAIDQRAMTARLTEANALRARFNGCASMPALAKERQNARFQDLGFKKASAVPEPTRSLLASAKDGEILPASLSAGAVELYAVCGRRTLKIDEEKRQQAESQLTMQEFEKLAQRYMHDLRKDALIEMR